MSDWIVACAVSFLPTSLYSGATCVRGMYAFEAPGMLPVAMVPPAHCANGASGSAPLSYMVLMMWCVPARPESTLLWYQRSLSLSVLKVQHCDVSPPGSNKYGLTSASFL